MTGRLDYTFSSLQPAWPYLRDGKLLAIAVGSPQRSPVLPDVPTVAEGGVPGFGYELWFGVFAPARTPASVVQQINRELVRSVSLPEVKDRLLAQGVLPRGSTAEEFDAFVRAEIAKLSEVVKRAGIKVD